MESTALVGRPDAKEALLIYTLPPNCLCESALRKPFGVRLLTLTRFVGWCTTRIPVFNH